MALLELRGISLRYRHGGVDVAALNGIDLDVHAGEMLAIVGASGSGKSSLLNVLGCLDRPDAGSYRVDGVDTATLDGDAAAALRRERFGFVFQRYHLLPQLDALGNVEIPAIYAGRGAGERRRAALQWLERLGVGERAAHRPGELSGGQQQRVAIARALINGGDVILADEPTGALDSRSGAALLDLLAELNAAGHTVILVTHDPRVAARASRVVELADGRVVRDSGARVVGDGVVRGAPRRAGHPRRAALWLAALRMALASLRGNRLRSGLSVLGIAVGIAAVVAITALGDAARDKVAAGLRAVMSGKLLVLQGNPERPALAQSRAFSAAELAAVRAMPGVRSVAPELRAELDAVRGSRSARVTLIGGNAATLAMQGLSVSQGRNLGSADATLRASVAVLDRRSAQTLFRPGEQALGARVMIGPLPFTVIGVADSSGSLGFGSASAQVLVPEATFLSRSGGGVRSVEAFWVGVEQQPGTPPAELAARLKHLLRAMHGVDDFQVISFAEGFRRFEQTTGALSLALSAVAALSLLVGGIGVMNIMLVSVAERTREIGIRKAVGSRARDIRNQFVVEAVVLCGIGGMGGVLLSLALALSANALQRTLHIGLPWTALLAAFAVSAAVGVLAGLLPAQRAAALRPAEALARE
ncbi:macrolide export ATP-binding/permease protein MacB [mine drainage metagenome]|uniref:Macrolide export ATP-binding/permease protein MacB n=1 Tax=mine drainage metagenome TaxID=410659 RepID=A0A1J5QTC7_9ZZZZ